MRALGVAACLVLLAAQPALALQQDCRGPGSIGTATMNQDGTITLNILTGTQQGAFAYHRGEPDYPRVLSHLGGLRPGEHKPVPPFC